MDNGETSRRLRGLSRGSRKRRGGAAREGGTEGSSEHRAPSRPRSAASRGASGSCRAAMDGDSDSCAEAETAPPKVAVPPEAFTPQCANAGCPKRTDDPDPKSDEESPYHLRDFRNNFSAVMNSYRDAADGALALSKEQQIRATEFAAALGYNKDPHRTSDLAGMLLHHHHRYGLIKSQHLNTFRTRIEAFYVRPTKGWKAQPL